jgi:hypothetical protein
MDVIKEPIFNDENNLNKENPVIPIPLTRFDRLKRRAL